MILLTPNCIDQNNSSNKDIYKIIESISGYKVIHTETKIPDNPYVEFYLIEFEDQLKRYKLLNDTFKNIYYSFIQILYPPSFKNNPIITNMQSILTLQADYLLSVYPTINIKDTFSIINTAMYNATLCFYFNLKNIELGFLFTDLLDLKLDLKYNHQFMNDFESNLNIDKKLSKLIKNKYIYAIPKIYCVDINDKQTYYNFSKNMMTFIHNNNGISNFIINISEFLENVCNINYIENQIDMISIMHDINYVLENHEEIKKYNNHPIQRPGVLLYENSDINEEEQIMKNNQEKKIIEYPENEDKLLNRGDKSSSNMLQYHIMKEVHYKKFIKKGKMKQDNTRIDKTCDPFYSSILYRYKSDSYVYINFAYYLRYKNYTEDDIKEKEENDIKDSNKEVFQNILFEFKSGEWIFNKKVWTDLMTKYNINEYDILYMILLTPNCIDQNNSSNEDIYKIIESISGYKVIHTETKIPDNPYVEFYLIEFEDQLKRYKLLNDTFKNIYYSFIQILYPPSFKNNPIITNMQSILTLQADYLLSVVYPTISINDTFSIINTVLYNATLCSYFNLKNIELAFLVTDNSKYVHNECFCKNILIHYVDIIDKQTLYNFSKNMMTFMHNNYGISNLILNISEFLENVCNVNYIENQIDMISVIHNIDSVQKYNESFKKYDNELIQRKGCIMKYENEIDSLYTNKLYRYIPNIPDKNESSINEQFTLIFNQALERASKYKKEDFTIPSNNYKKTDGKIKVRKLFFYSSNNWKLINRKFWPNFIKTNNLNDNSVLDLILLSPCCFNDTTNRNEDIYKMVCTLTGNQNVDVKDMDIDNAFVVFIFCGSIKNIEEQIGVDLIPTKNEYLAFVQIQYPIHLQNDPNITNMQTYLMMHIDYMLNFYPSENILESSHFINTAFHNINQSHAHINTAMNFVFSNLPIQSNENDLIYYPFFGKELDSILNSDKTLKKFVQKYYEYSFPNIEWFDIRNYKTYYHLFKKIIEFFQNTKRTKTNIADITTNLIANVKSINKIKSQIDMNNYMNKSSETFEIKIEESQKKKMPVSIIDFLLSKSKIIFKEKTWEQFLLKNNINDKNSVYLVLISNSNNEVSDNILKVFSGSHETSDRFYYCGLIEGLCSEFKLKTKKTKLAKSHLVLYNPGAYIGDDDRFIEEFTIGMQCNLILTLVDENDYNKQIEYSNKLNNLLEYQLKRKNKITKLESNEYLFILKENNKKKEEIENSLHDNISFSYKKCYFDESNRESFTSFLSKIIDILPDEEYNISNINEYFKNIAKNNSYIFLYVNIFKYADITGKKNKDAKKFDIDSKYFDKIALNIVVMLENISPNFYSFTSVNKLFLLLYYETMNLDGFDKILNLIRSKVIQKYSDLAAKRIKLPDDFHEMTKDLVISVEKHIQNSVTHIDDDIYLSIIDSLFEKMKDKLFSFIIDNHPTSISKDMIMCIYTLKEKLIVNEFMNAIKRIQVIYNETHKKKQIDKTLDQKQIAQNSMKYILALRESFKEMTIEISCNEDLEAHIKQDF